MSGTSLYSIIFLVLGVLVLLAAVKLYRRIKLFAFTPRSYTGELPTVSVCIPARNETHAMTRCLESVLASDYEKLEVIVLDDSSVDNTSALIKAFAHSGVRFVEGSSLPAGWLGKNHALQGLLNEASGQYIIFMDVDAVIKPTTISSLIATMVTDKLTMTTVIPQRLDRWRASVFLGSLRYLWTLLLDSSRTPATSSALWCVRSEALQLLGGITSFKDTVQPEVYVASRLSGHATVQTIISNPILGVSFEKKWSSQVETSIRLLSPITGAGVRSLGSLGILILLNVTLIGGLLSLFTQPATVVGAALLYIASMILLFSIYFKAIWGRLWWFGGVILWPLLLIQECVLLAVSIIQYARGRVSWKGRRIVV